MPSLDDLITPFLQRPRAERLAIVEAVRSRRWAKPPPKSIATMKELAEALEAEAGLENDTEDETETDDEEVEE